MDTLQLKLFVSLTKTLNFTKTANEFYVTQPTVSNYIKSLESSIGVKLLNRDSRSVSLTPEGIEFIGYANQILSLQMDAENRLKNMAEGRRGFLKIAMLSSAVEIFSECLAEFNRENRNVQINVDLIEGIEMTTAVAQQTYDIYFALEHMLQQSDSVEYITNEISNLHLFVHKDMAPDIDMNNWKTLQKYHFCSATDSEFTLSSKINTICANRGIQPDIINYYNRAGTILLAVNSGVGMAILPERLQDYFQFPNVVSLPIEGEDAKITSVVAWNKTNTNPDIRKFVELEAIKKYKNSL